MGSYIPPQGSNTDTSKVLHKLSPHKSVLGYITSEANDIKGYVSSHRKHFSELNNE